MIRRIREIEEKGISPSTHNTLRDLRNGTKGFEFIYDNDTFFQPISLNYCATLVNLNQGMYFENDTNTSASYFYQINQCNNSGQFHSNFALKLKQHLNESSNGLKLRDKADHHIFVASLLWHRLKNQGSNDGDRLLQCVLYHCGLDDHFAEG